MQIYYATLKVHRVQFSLLMDMVELHLSSSEIELSYRLGAPDHEDAKAGSISFRNKKQALLKFFQL
jgi:hypothetical protein